MTCNCTVHSHRKKRESDLPAQSREKNSPNNFATMRETSDANGVNQCYNVLSSMTINYLWAAPTGCHMWNWGAYARVLNSCLPIFRCKCEYSTSDKFFWYFQMSRHLISKFNMIWPETHRPHPSQDLWTSVCSLDFGELHATDFHAEIS